MKTPPSSGPPIERLLRIMAMLRDGRIIPRRLPANQSMESWQEAYTQFQNL